MNRNEYTFRRTVGAIGCAMLIFLLMITVFEFLLLFLDEILMMLEISSLSGNLIYYGVYAVGYLVSFMLPVAFLKRFIRNRGLTWSPMQTTWRISPWWILAVPAGIMIIFSASYINSLLVSLLGLLQSSNSMQDVVSQASYTPAPYEWVIQFILISVVPGFCEEFFFRGAILTNLLPFGRSNAILISALLFALMHQNPSQFFYTFVGGVVLGVLYERTGSIWPGTVLHLCNNFASLGESILPYGAKNDLSALVLPAMLNMVILVLGTVSLAILILKYFSAPRDFRGGVFGSTEGSLSVAPAYPVEGRWIKLFLTPSMIIFLLIVLFEIILMMLVMMLGGA